MRMTKRVLAKAWLACAAVAAIIPAAAHAQALPAGTAASFSFSKSEAILGAPSALAAIMSEQHAGPAVPAALRPASYSFPLAVPAILRTGTGVSEGVFSGRPDVFGSVALRVNHTPLDARWQSVEHGRPSGAAGHFAAALTSDSPVEQLKAVNHYVNRRVEFEDDQRHFGRPDVWSSANETFRSGRGDCEDYAIAKYQMLRTAGFSGRDLYLVIVRDLVRRADHAVLVARAAGHMYVLDNGSDEIIDSETISDYRPVLTFASSGEWTHGYRLQSAPVNIASNEQAPVTLAAADSQRSLSASLLAFRTGFKR
jgi:predicted transglutaminase-like cysteine proteinase